MYCDLWLYVWLEFKSGFYSRAGYSGARTVFGGPTLIQDLNAGLVVEAVAYVRE